MRFRRLVFLLLFSGLGSAVRAETIVDVSKEWNAHRSSMSIEAPVPIAVHPSTAVAASSTTYACECDKLTPQEKLDGSTYAFTGTVSEAQVPKNGKRVIIFDVDEIFKGSPPAEMKVSAEVTGTDCDSSYLPGQSYLVFGRWEWGTVVTSPCMGTRFLDKAKTAALGPSEELKEKLYVRLHNACMGRRDTVCCLNSLKALRAGYYVPESEEGCPDGSVPDRLHCAGSYTWCIPFMDKSHR